jgi:hypothetical protein
MRLLYDVVSQEVDGHCVGLFTLHVIFVVFKTILFSNVPVFDFFIKLGFLTFFLFRLVILLLLDFYEPLLDAIFDFFLAIRVVSHVTQIKLVLVAEHDRKQYLTASSVRFSFV